MKRSTDEPIAPEGLSSPSLLTYQQITDYDRLLAERHGWWILSRASAAAVIIVAVFFVTQPMFTPGPRSRQSIVLYAVIILLAAGSHFTARMAWPTRRRIASAWRDAGKVLLIAVALSFLLLPLMFPSRPMFGPDIVATSVELLVGIGVCAVYAPRVFQRGPPELQFPD